jgi:hypothetical protein
MGLFVITKVPLWKHTKSITINRKTTSKSASPKDQYGILGEEKNACSSDLKPQRKETTWKTSVQMGG